MPFRFKYSMYFIVLCVIYIVAFVIGFFNGVDDFNTIEFQKTDAPMSIFQISDSFDLFISIAKNNLEVAFRFFIFGLLSLGIFPPLLSFYNGFVFGNVTGCSTHILSQTEILNATLPHVFEFVGLNLFAAVGFYLSYEYIVKNRFPKIQTAMSLILTAICIVVLAAFSESYISISI